MYIYMYIYRTFFLQYGLLTKLEPDINSVVKVHPYLSHSCWHPVDGGLLGAGSLCLRFMAKYYPSGQLSSTSYLPSKDLFFLPSMY
jgi:hypothetical protein